MRQFISLVIILVVLELEANEGGPIFALVGPQPLRVKENEVFFITATYKFCYLGADPCPRCPRRVFVNTFNQSACLGTARGSQLDCAYHNCEVAKFRAPAQPGSYHIRMYDEQGTENCTSHSQSGKGNYVGTVVVGTPPSQPEGFEANAAFRRAIIEWTKQAKGTVYTVIMRDGSGRQRKLAERTTKTRMFVGQLAPGTAYNVSVVATNAAGSSPWAHYTFSTRQASMSLKVAPKNKTVVEGQPFSLKCYIVGRPRPSITWFKDGKPIGHQAHERTLYVPRASTEDEGEYVCLGSNAAPGRNITVKASVVVIVPPVVESLYSLSSHETIRGSLGQTIVLLCGLHKERHVTYAWFKDGDLLPNSSENTNELTVALQEQQDFGVYECEAFNQAAKVRKRLEVFNEDEEGRAASFESLASETSTSYYYYIVGVLGCACVILLVAIFAVKRHYRRKLTTECTNERPYLTPCDEVPRSSSRAAQQSVSSTSLENSRPLPPIPGECSAKVDGEDTRYADLQSIEKPLYQELEREAPEKSVMEFAYENATRTNDDKPYLEVMP